MALLGFSEIDNQMLRLLLNSGGRIRSSEISRNLGIPLSTVQRRRRRMEDSYLLKYYS
ncbi:MAG: AsnC family transcriptional regulator, partial [Rhabdochlamydiaceae bacterium]